MKAKVDDINGLYIIYEIEGKRYMDDSTFYEIMNYNKGDIVKISEERFKQLGEIK